MRLIMIPLVVIACSPDIVFGQSRPAAPSINPCSFLTRELVQKVSIANPKSVDAGPTQEKLGSKGVYCMWGDVGFALDPYTPAAFDDLGKKVGKDWEAISGVGDAAYLQNVRDAAGGLYVRVGARTFVVDVTIPVGSTTAAMKPKIIDAANAIVAKLR